MTDQIERNGSPVVRRTLSAQVAQRIRDAIEGGAYGAGERLPSERELCVQFGVSRTALREAQRELERTGYVEVRHGSGSFVRSRLHAQRRALADWLGNHDNPIANLLEMRSLLEPGVAELAARRADAAGVAALQACVDAMTEPGAGIDDAIAADERFHGVLAELTGNPLVAQLIGYTLTAMGGERNVTLSTPEGVRAAALGHQRVVDAIRAADPAAAARAMQLHLDDATRWAMGDGRAEPAEPGQ